MNTYRVNAADYAEKTPLAEGYKIFDWDWTGLGDYCYAEGGSVEGSVHTVDGELSPCNWGLHFSKNPVDCLRYKGSMQWMKFAKVSAFDEIEDCNDGKTVARTLRIDKVLTWCEFIDACKAVPKKLIEQKNGIRDGYGISYSSGIRDGYGISYSSGISCGSGISYSSGISDGSGISNGSGISDGSGISCGSGISYSSGIHYSSGISDGYGINNGSGISDGYGVSNGYGISDGYGISCGHGISCGYGISYSHGISYSYGVNNSKYCRECEGIARCIFAYKTTGKLLVFNKPVSEARFREINAKIEWLACGWYPNFTNAELLRAQSDGQEWTATPADRITGRTDKEAYADIPESLVAYIKSLPEYDEAIYRAVTERED